MKQTILYALVLALLSAALPFLCLLPLYPASAPARDIPAAATAAPLPQSTAAGAASSATPAATAEPDPILLYDAATESVVTVPLQAYLVGAAACEMPVDWPDDALCAQMVASHSYALYQRDHGGSTGGGYCTVNSALCSGWASAEVLQSRWGDEYAANNARLQALADVVATQILRYGGQPAAACYHAMSNGHTEASQNVWLEALPYLQGVDSAWDKYSEDYEVTIQYSSGQFSDAVASGLGITLTGDPGGWLGASVWDAAGYIKTIELGGQSVGGTQVRAALSLRSACFAIAWRGGQFVITTRGYGHGVGLSQYGARTMAEGGAGWQDILAYYFPGTELTPL